MRKQTLDIDKIIELYLENKDKGKYWVARELGLNENSVSTIIDKYFPNSEELDKELEERILESISLFPYTGTINKISKHLGVSRHSINQIIIKTSNKKLWYHFQHPKSSPKKLTDKDIYDILEGSKNGIGHDQMGLIKNVDGASIRNIRKKFLTPKEYEQYHSINRFYEGDYNSYYNSRGDKFLSTWEEKVADFLFESQIKYHSNIRLSFKNKNYSPDFYLPESKTFIEVFGMSNVKGYREKMEEKIEWYKNNKIKCLFLYEEDFQLKKKETENYKKVIKNFVSQIENTTFNNHVKNIIIN